MNRIPLCDGAYKLSLAFSFSSCKHVNRRARIDTQAFMVSPVMGKIN